MSALEQNKFVYETLFKVFFKSPSNNDADKNLSRIAFMASFAWLAHPGYFADIRLEKLCYKIGKEIWDKNKINGIQQERSEKRRVLHVVSETYATGGHTRLLFNIVRNDIDSIHSLLLTQQKSIDVPLWLSEQVILSGGDVYSICEYSGEKQVAVIQKEITSSKYDKLFYHIHPDDAAAVAALAAAPRPAALVINHADHVFWLGSALADVTVCYRTWSLLFSEKYRASQKVSLLPTPIGALNVKGLGSLKERKYSARKKLGIEDNEVIILTVASYTKFIPAGKYNYFKTVKNILDKNPKVRLKIVGIAASDDLKKLEYIHDERIEFLGVVSEPQIYYEAADIYLDSMPFSSFTSLFEAMLFGCYPILQFAPVDTLTIENEPSLKNLVFHAKNEEEQIVTIQYAIDNPHYREEIAQACAWLINENYVGTGWLKQLEELYNYISSKPENSRSLSGLQNVAFVTDNDVEAAQLAHAQHGNTSAILSRIIHRYLSSISSSEIIEIYYNLLFSKGRGREILGLRQMLYFVKRKMLG